VKVLGLLALVSSFSLSAAVDVRNVMDHLKELQKIADQNNGNRAAGTRGHEESANYVAQKLLAANYDVKLETIQFLKFIKHSAAISFNGAALEEHKDFQIMMFSGAASTTAKLVGVDLKPGLGNTSTSGCEMDDFKNFPQGAIAVIQRGGCIFQPKTENAQAAGASGVIILNQGNTADRMDIMGGNLSEGDGIKIPVFTVSYEMGMKLASDVNNFATLTTDTTITARHSMNVIAETRTGDADKVIMVGAHLDSVDEGPGINDNGSGVAAVLEIAIQMKNAGLKNKIRFGWFSGEEIGLIGSNRYVESLSDTQKKQITHYINIDMLASPNYKYSVLAGDATLAKAFKESFTSMGLPVADVEMNGRSDYAAFDEAGILVGGLDTGAEEIKTTDEAALFGGQAGVAFDACYHQACDTIDNISIEALEVNTKVLEKVLIQMSAQG
jgi:Zn-dependent M28 family amino/carboxypeptidase